MKRLDQKRYLKNEVTYPVIRVCHCSECMELCGVLGVMWEMNRLGEWRMQ
jgi:hypothetical protein